MSKQFTLEQVKGLMEFRHRTWKKQLDEAKNDPKSPYRPQLSCLVASVVDIKDDIRTIERAQRLLDRYENMFLTKKVERKLKKRR